MIDIKKLDELPFKEGRKAYLTRKHGSLYNIFDYHENSRQKLNPWVLSERVISKFLGKSFDDAYSYYCKLIPNWDAIYFKKSFKEDFIEYAQMRRYSNFAKYYIDEQGNIQKLESEIKRKPIYITSDDYKTELRHKETGHKKSQFREVWTFKTMTRKWHSTVLGAMTQIWEQKDKFLYFEYAIDGYKTSPANERYIAFEKDFIPIVVAGSVRYFDSKQDPEFKRFMAEKRKSKKSIFQKAKAKERLEAELARMAYLQQQKVIKERQEDLIKIQAHGFDPKLSFRKRKE